MYIGLPGLIGNRGPKGVMGKPGLPGIINQTLWYYIFEIFNLGKSTIIVKNIELFLFDKEY